MTNTETLLRNAVDAYRTMQASAKWNDRKHRDNMETARNAITAYATAAGISVPIATRWVHDFSNR